MIPISRLRLGLTSVILLTALCVLTVSADDGSQDADGVSEAPSHEASWSEFKQKHKRVYNNSTEERKRFGIWLKNKLMIDEHNSQAKNSEKTGSHFQLSDNHLSDWTKEEYSRLRGFRSILTRKRSGSSMNFPLIPHKIVIPPPNSDSTYTNTVPVSQLPTAVNWTALGYVNPVENQGSCGDCWSFSAAGSIEGQYYNSTGTSAIMSEQNLLDCSSIKLYGNSGCNGGSMIGAFQYVIDNKGINAYSTYPYTGQLGSCRYNNAQNLGYITGYKTIQQYNELALQQAVALIGPVSIGINAQLPSFQLYSGGVYKPSSCDPEELDHAMLAVGYGTTSDGVDYWLLKNSWGTDWGIQGYMMLARNADNMCGVATDASFPSIFVSSGITVANQGIPNGVAPPTITQSPLLLVFTFIYVIIASLL